MGRALLDQQLWCWGRDIVRPQGNVLLRYGFSRSRPPEGRFGSSAYTLRPDPRIRITLWGFGVFYGSAGSGGLFLKRRSFSPLLTPQPDPGGAWSQADLPPVHSPASREECRTARRLLCGVLGWIAEYERWVRTELGPDHRRLCVAEWPKAALPADEMAEGWLKLARFFEEEESA
jgi:hypothetical protein